MKTARRGYTQEPYVCQKDWPEDCFVQCGDNGMVLKATGFEATMTSENFKELGENIAENYAYTTAFFEAFPNNPNTFIRGEGKSVEEAEESAWKKFRKYADCEEHEFEKRNYRNGAGFCKKCNMFKSRAFEPWEPCVVCGKKTFYHQVDDNSMMCKEHYYQLPYEELDKMTKYCYTEEEWKVEAKLEEARGYNESRD
jgi:hypothetical protein